eukprot:TRINITY_DN18340_c2_g1_i1.p1 TRINITY_DN18340_c2_g1~~TRINITY_DN18340_c2_g1_i1.p1  ORF type:complete len:1511 (-),score=466.48 TRINITY_DN18340_c2_g1_i1:362-4894(-)
MAAAELPASPPVEPTAADSPATNGALGSDAAAAAAAAAAATPVAEATPAVVSATDVAAGEAASPSPQAPAGQASPSGAQQGVVLSAGGVPGNDGIGIIGDGLELDSSQEVSGSMQRQPSDAGGLPHGRMDHSAGSPMQAEMSGALMRQNTWIPDVNAFLEGVEERPAEEAAKSDGQSTMSSKTQALKRKTPWDDLLNKVRKRLRSIQRHDKVSWEKLFKEFDSSGDGVLEALEFRALMRRGLLIGANCMPEHELMLVFDHIDDDGSGEIGYQEFTEFIEEECNVDDLDFFGRTKKSEPPLRCPNVHPKPFMKTGWLHWTKEDEMAFRKQKQEEYKIAEERARLKREREKRKKKEAEAIAFEQSRRGSKESSVKPMKSQKASRKWMKMKEQAKAQDKYRLLERLWRPNWRRSSIPWREAVGSIVRDDSPVMPRYNPKATVEEILAEKLPIIQRRLKATLYAKEGGVNWEEMFLQYDKSGDGELQLDEFTQAVRRELRLPRDQVSDEEVRLLFEHLDADGSGEVDIQEIQIFVADQVTAAKKAVMPTLEVIQRVKNRLEVCDTHRGGIDWIKLFKKLDTSGDGELSLVEFRSLIRKDLLLDAREIRDWEVRAVFHYLDEDGSGEVGADEFIKFIYAEEEEEKEELSESDVLRQKLAELMRLAYRYSVEMHKGDTDFSPLRLGRELGKAWWSSPVVRGGKSQQAALTARAKFLRNDADATSEEILNATDVLQQVEQTYRKEAAELMSSRDLAIGLIGEEGCDFSRLDEFALEKFAAQLLVHLAGEDNGKSLSLMPDDLMAMLTPEAAGHDDFLDFSEFIKEREWQEKKRELRRLLLEPVPEPVPSPKCDNCKRQYTDTEDGATECPECKTERGLTYLEDLELEALKLSIMDVKLAMSEFGLKIPENPAAVLHAMNLANKKNQKPKNSAAGKRQQLLAASMAIAEGGGGKAILKSLAGVLEAQHMSVQEFVKRMDDGSGSLNKGELGEGLATVGLSLSKKEFQELWEFVDSNRTGTITARELVKSINDANSDKAVDVSEQGKIVLKKINQTIINKGTRPGLFFKSIDLDGSGSLSMRELRVALSRLGCALTKPELDELAKILDPDGSGEITSNEFVKALKQVDPEGTKQSRGGIKPDAKKQAKKDNRKKMTFVGIAKDFGPANGKFTPGAILRAISAALKNQGCKVEDFFYTVDDDQSGFIGKSEMKGPIQDMGFKLDKAGWMRFWDRLDPDKSGNISVKEFKQVLEEVAKEPEEADTVEVEEPKWEDYAAIKILKEIKQKLMEKMSTARHVFMEGIGGQEKGYVTRKQLRNYLQKTGIAFEEADFRQVLILLDPDGIGRIEAKIFVDAVERCGSERGLTELASRLTRAIAKAEEAYSSADDEFELAAVEHPQGARHLVTLRTHFIYMGITLEEFFTTIDGDADEVVSRQQLYSGFKEVGHKMSKNKMTEIIAFIDPDGNGTVTLADWTRAFEVAREMGAKPWKYKAKDKDVTAEFDEQGRKVSMLSMSSKSDD